MFERFGRQMGHTQANRLWQGKFLTSNVGVDGALVDFGSFRPVPSWRQCYGYPEAVFGTELEFIGAAADSLAFHFRKYGVSRMPAAELKARAEQSLEAGFREAALGALNLANVGTAACNAIAGELRAYFNAQQKDYVQLDEEATWRLPWLQAAYSESASCCAGPAELATRNLIEDIICASVPATERACTVRHAAGAMAVWLKPREEIDELVLFHMLGRLLASPDVMFGRGASIETFLALLISRNRRSWMGLPPGLIPLGYVTDGISQAIYAEDLVSARRTLLLEGPVIEGRCVLFGNRVPLEELDPYQLGHWGARASRVLPQAALSKGLVFDFKGCSVRVPPPARPRSGMPDPSRRHRAIRQTDAMWWEEHLRRRSSYMRRRQPGF